MYESPNNGIVKPQNFYRFGKLDEVKISDVSQCDEFPAYFIFESSKKITFENCYFPFGIIIYGFYDELEFINSNLTVLTTDVNARKLTIVNDPGRSANRIAFKDSKLKYLTNVKISNAQVVFTSINDIYVNDEVFIEDSDVTIGCFTLNTDKLSIKGKVRFDMDSQELAYSYYPLSILTPRIRPGLTFSELNAIDDAKAAFTTNWNELFFLNGKEVNPYFVTLPEEHNGLEDFYLRKGPGDEPGQAFCY